MTAIARQLGEKSLYGCVYDLDHQTTKVFKVDMETQKAKDLKLQVKGQVLNAGNNKLIAEEGKLYIRSQVYIGEGNIQHHFYQYDVETKNLQEDKNKQVSAIAYHYTKKIIFKGCADGTVEASDQSLSFQPFDELLEVMSMDPAERYLAVGSEQGAVKVFELEKLFSGEHDPLMQLKDHEQGVN